MITIKQAYDQVSQQLKAAGIASYHLDTQLLLKFVTGHSREFLAAHNEHKINDHQLDELRKLADRRCQREPIAYLLGEKEFYGRTFQVNHHSLIPRPESEVLIDQLAELDLPDNHPVRLLDVGTGSGCLAITARLEHPTWTVEACDISGDALTLAQTNADQLQATVRFFESDLLDNCTDQYDIIMANLPYVNPSWAELVDYPELDYEPAIALYAADGGLGLIKKLFTQTPNHLTDGGYLILEMDRRQIDQASQLARDNGFQVIQSLPFCLVLRLEQAAKAK